VKDRYRRTAPEVRPFQNTFHRPIFVRMSPTALPTALAALLLTACTGAAQEPNTTAMTTPQTTNPYYSRTDTSKLNVSDAEWKRILPDELYHIAREAGTERAFTGKYWDFEGVGTYYCSVCGNPLFKSDSKFGSGCGWPSFFETMRPNSVLYVVDKSHGMIRDEVRCGRCNSHLGHVFDDGPPPTYKRFCMNSPVLDFEPDGGK
jgi:peptide-methionine (R)-S-oxide reductase